MSGVNSYGERMVRTLEGNRGDIADHVFLLSLSFLSQPRMRKFCEQLSDDPSALLSPVILPILTPSTLYITIS